MQVRYYLSPMVVVDGVRMPKVAAVLDPTRIGPDGPMGYRHSSIDLGTHALSIVVSDDFGPIEADTACIMLTGDLEHRFGVSSDEVKAEDVQRLRGQESRIGVGSLPDRGKLGDVLDEIVRRKGGSGSVRRLWTR